MITLTPSPNVSNFFESNSFEYNLGSAKTCAHESHTEGKRLCLCEQISTPWESSPTKLSSVGSTILGSGKLFLERESFTVVEESWATEISALEGRPFCWSCFDPRWNISAVREENTFELRSRILSNEGLGVIAAAKI